METTPIKDLVGQTVLVNDGETIKQVHYEDFKASTINNCEFLLFYFGAHWAPPCRLFTSTLNENFY